MRRAFLGSIAVCLAGAGMSLAQPWGPPAPPPPGMASVNAAQAAAEPGAGSPAAATPPATTAPSGCSTCGQPGMICWPEWYPPQIPCRDEGLTLYAWASIEQLVWWIKDSPLSVPLITTSAADQGPPRLDNPNTIVLYGAQDIDYDTAYGLKLACGVFDPKLNLGLEGSVFRLEDEVARFSHHVDRNSSQYLGIPFLQVPENLPAVLLIANPEQGLSYGGVNVTTSARFWGAEGNVATTIYANDGWVIDLLGGFRYFDLKESLRLSTASFPGDLGAVFFEGDPYFRGGVLTRDDFDTQNRFYGGQIGFRTETYLGRFYGSFKAMCAVGANHQYVSIRGSSTRVSNTGRVLDYNATTGILAGPSNSIRISQDTATVIPIFEATVGCDITSWLRAYAGYTFMYWGNVTRPGDQIQLILDGRTLPTSASYVAGVRSDSPRNPFDRSDFWAQGLSFGLAIRF
ncbi:MAG: BBP7 family outer membrane beta-barrel protein [Gemmatales bacterium]|nr:BBP7 family outer membrane beta-barrel protein [Gemmatales bacterium]MDW8385939.1 BBP7 family outer membrane beta-barrel protein [Gemmatales bacterium]